MEAPKPSSSADKRSSGHDDADNIGHFRRLEQIGKGSFALVFRGVHMKRRTLVAIKSVQLFKLNKKLKENLVSEIKILQSLHHPHIVSLIQCVEAAHMMHLVMEYCEIGDLSLFIKKRAALADSPLTDGMFQKYPSQSRGGLNEVVARHFLKQIASAMEFMRTKNYVHRDIKPQNLLLNPSPQYYAKHRPKTMPYEVNDNSLVPATGIESLPMLKIADFGFARVLPQTSLAETLCGSPLYMAPEILRYEKYDAKADLWSVGTVLYEMMYARPPFRANNHVELVKKIDEQNDKIKFPDGIPISREVKQLIRVLLKRSPLERIGFDGFFEHVVVKGHIPGLVGADRSPESSVESHSQSKRAQKLPATGSSPSPKPATQEQEMTPYSQSPRMASTPPRRSSRPPTGDGQAGTPPFVTEERRSTSSRAAPIDQNQQSQRDRRPTIATHATAPGRPTPEQDRAAAVALGQPERRQSYKRRSPPTSMLREQLDADQISRGGDERLSREARERAAQDVAFERDYVVVERRQVEVNAFADELANNPQLYGRRDVVHPPQAAPMVRRATTQVTPAAQNTSQAIQITNRQRPDAMPHRASSYERRYGPNPTSATSVIAKALKGANLRVFGTSVSPPSGRGLSPPKGYGAFPTYPTAQGSLVLVGDKALDTKDEDWRLVYTVEELASRSDVVYGFAEVKYQQLLPTPPSTEQGLGIAQTGKQEADEEEDDGVLTVDAVVEVSEEALVLYVKALAILAKAIDLAGCWWGQKNRGEGVNDPSAVSLRNPYSRASPATVSNRMNNVVQWSRNRFNECLEKSEFVGRKLLDAQRSLPLDHPAHPSNHPAASGSTGSANSIGTSAENITLTSGVTAEKLMYERAVDLSRAAAVKELVGKDLGACEIGYVTAVRMLDAILESDDEVSPTSKRSGKEVKDARDDEPINGLVTEDRHTVIKLVETIRERLRTLRKKMEIQKSSKRTSLSGTPAQQQQQPSNKVSPLGTPVTTSTPPK